MELICIKEGQWTIIQVGETRAKKFPVYGNKYSSSEEIEGFYFIDD